MKRFLVFFVVLTVVFGLIGCGAALSKSQSEGEDGHMADSLERAEQLIWDGQYFSALESIEQIIEQDTANDRAYVLKAEVYLMAINQANNDLNHMIAEDIEKVQDQGAYEQRIEELFEDYGLTLMIPADESAKPETIAGIETNVFGNMAVNLRGMVWPLEGDNRNLTQGNFAFQGEYLYFADYSDNNAIYRINVNGNDKDKVSEDSASSINVIGDYIFYICANEENRVYKVKTDGSERTQLTDDAAAYLYVLGDTAYYTNQYDGNSIYRVSTDGGDQSYFAESAQMIFADETHLYYSTADERNFVCINLSDMTTEYLLNDEWHINPQVYDGWLYFVGEGNPLTIKKVKLDGSERDDVWAYDSKINNFAIVDHHLIVHVRDVDHQEFVMRFDLESMEQTEQVENSGEALCVDEFNNVYFQIPEGLFPFRLGCSAL